MWNRIKIESNIIYCLKIDQAEFYLKQQEKVYLIKSILTENHEFGFAATDKNNVPEKPDWRNFVADKLKTINVMPIMPNRPLVMRPSTEVFILPGRSCTLYVLIPVWVQLYMGTGTDSANLLIEEPSAHLSGTWFGDPDNGTISYDFETPVYFSYQDLKPQVNHVICPINIHNESTSQLKIERLIIQTEHLKIYNHEDRLISNEMKVRYRGELNPSNISFGKNVPSFAKGSELITSERIQPAEGILRKSFYFLKNTSNY